MKTINECLNFIQTGLNAPKSQKNDFGNFKYRHIEDIFAGLKPLLEKTGCIVTCSDEMIAVGDRYYVKATATLSRGADETISVTAMARETENKKGMDEAQITGSSSSYARKYAVCGLFAIDNGLDVDAMDNTKIGKYFASDLEKTEYQRLNKHKAFNKKMPDGKTLRATIKDKWSKFTTQEEVLKCLKYMEEQIRNFESEDVKVKSINNKQEVTA